MVRRARCLIVRKSFWGGAKSDFFERSVPMNGSQTHSRRISDNLSKFYGMAFRHALLVPAMNADRLLSW
jgi:hypothetical protein